MCNRWPAETFKQLLLGFVFFFCETFLLLKLLLCRARVPGRTVPVWVSSMTHQHLRSHRGRFQKSRRASDLLTDFVRLCSTSLHSTHPFFVWFVPVVFGSRKVNWLTTIYFCHLKDPPPSEPVRPNAPDPRRGLSKLFFDAWFLLPTVYQTNFSFGAPSWYIYVCVRVQTLVQVGSSAAPPRGRAFPPFARSRLDWCCELKDTSVLVPHLGFC